VLATFVDGRIRYINQAGKLAIVEDLPADMKGPQSALVKAGEAAIRKIGPWDKPRRPPPTAGSVRLSFLVSDGLYFGEGPFEAISRDPIGGPVLQAATQLLTAVTRATAKGSP